MTITENIRKELQTLVDSKYQEFHSALVPGTENILGVRIPQLRVMAKEMIGVYSSRQPIPSFMKKPCFKEWLSDDLKRHLTNK